MARLARMMSRTGLYPIVFRGICRQNIFEETQDFEKILEIIKKVKKEKEYHNYSEQVLNYTALCNLGLAHYTSAMIFPNLPTFYLIFTKFLHYLPHMYIIIPRETEKSRHGF